MQNLVSMNLTNDQLTAVDAALDALEANLSAMVSLTPQQRRSVPRMGDKSESFCRQTLSLLGQNLQVVNPSLGLPEAQADLAALDALRPRLQRLPAQRGRKRFGRRQRVAEPDAGSGENQACDEQRTRDRHG